MTTFKFCAVLFLISNAHLLGQFDPDANKIIKDINPTDVIYWEAVGPATEYSDGTIEIGLRLTTEQNFTLYTSKVSFTPPAGFDLVKQESPPTTRIIDPITGDEVDVYSGGEFFLYFKGLEKFRGELFDLKVKFLGCTTRICLFPYTQTINLKVLPGEGGPPTSGSELAVAGEDFESQLAAKVKSGAFSFWMLIFVVFLGGILTNLTPCVAPMIPITMRLLANQKGSPPLVNSSLYATGIMLTYTTLGMAATLSGSAFGTFMSSVWLNLAFATLMALLGMSMLGFGDLSKLQMIGSRIGSGKPSKFNTLLMGTGAGLVAAPCTGPILGALLAFTAGKGETTQGAILMATYSFGFALPYVLLGTASAKVASVKVSPFVQLSTKVVFAAVMFGLTFYYLRIPAYKILPLLKPYWGTVGAGATALGFAMAVFWLLKPGLYNNKASMLVPTITLGVGLFAASQWATSAKESDLKWYKDKAAAFAAAKETGRPILIDNWAEWCEACKKMDKTTFIDPKVQQELTANWIVLKLDLTEGTEADDEHMETYGIQGLPTLVLLGPNGNVEVSENIVGYVSASGLLSRIQSFKKTRAL